MHSLELHAVTKTFPGQRALSAVDFTVDAGRVHALLGHNGSGKSTLIKVLSGYHRPDDERGVYRIGEQGIRFGDPEAVHRAGARFIHQDLGLVSNLTVLENLKLGTGLYRCQPGWRIDWTDERRHARLSLRRAGVHDVDPDDEVGRLAAVQRTQIAIARALQDEKQVRVLVLDEVTAAMGPEQVQQLFARLEGLRSTGVAIIYVTHKLEEVIRVADTVTVLRDGHVVQHGNVRSHDETSLARLIAGSDIVTHAASTRREASQGATLEFVDVHGGRELHGLNLEVHAGEIVGIAGLDGSGVHEVPGLLLGEVPIRQGSVRVQGTALSGFGARQLQGVGVGVLPAERRLKAIPGMTVRENLTVSKLSSFWKGGVFRTRAERADAQRLLIQFGVLPAEPERAIETLSGGNQQKVFVARLMRTEPSVLVLDEPTLGVDVAGSAEILDFVARVAAEHGVSVIICSSDMADLARVCTRVVVVARGQAALQLQGDEVTREAIVEASYATA